ncbi:thiosulfate sulfurtransferase [Leifsonia xyli subsp. cynodontis DSM 46306]|uniref:Rhodanese domain-containing protein n=1 Tax=Leifsonia xyli subsp. cynodontis DSM 46306 TaxID=1389489 RepID=U3P561_LEIXC|nr:sulfurtransferase [Leifsonia xyli]AGW40881.1 thiosulfate sulfurtransferase [Leifsonia xyli subsp. cynodontis DSM 46306]
MTSPLVSASDLAVALAGPRPPVVLDVRWKLGGPPGAGEYAKGHLPSAVYVDLDTELAGHGAPTDGRHPLPPIAVFEAAARRWGVRHGEAVVVYDDVSGLSAARAWWLLRHAGVEDVRVLDGGLRAWEGALSTEDAHPERGDVSLSYGALPTLDADGAAAVARDGVLLDARAGERYRGEAEPVDPRAGHIPGAVSAPTAGNVGPDGRMLAPAALAERFAALGVRPEASVGVYCGSGVTAAHEALALEAAGLPMPALYPGSFSAWSNDPAREVAAGAEP